ncbi:hypothetical protein N0V83_004586 [Neocucurbitaria cava]|uniref:Uncharacterized protein n=1 Tax=Neocucurbitaria cava TaxID=798079 RepID=A0A9W9CMC2_9PLEO|nr:hypothetical protein N0V83_004586 [Neocucurbitaria cava]
MAYPNECRRPMLSSYHPSYPLGPEESEISNPNQIPLAPLHGHSYPRCPHHSSRRSEHTDSYRPEHQGEYRSSEPHGSSRIDDEGTSGLTPSSLADLAGRTARAYTLLVTYSRDSGGGQRWLAPDIEHIRGLGQYLLGDIRALKSLQRRVARVGASRALDYGGEAEYLAGKAEEAAEKLSRECEFVMAEIKAREY